MTSIDASSAAAWADIAGPSCSLPTTERPLRLAELDALIVETTAIERDAPTAARFVLRFDPAVAGRTAELTARETQCCSFFEFTLTVAGGSIELLVQVPETHVDVLDALVERANAAGSGRPR